MLGTILSLILAAIFEYMAIYDPSDLSINLFPLFLSTGLIFLALPVLISTLSLPALQHSEQNATPRLLELVRKDSRLGYIKLWLIFFPLVTFALILFSPLLKAYPAGIAIWLVGLGLAIDCVYLLYKRLLDYCNPMSIIARFSQEADLSIREEREIDLCHWFDGLSDTACKAVRANNSSVANQALTEMQLLARRFLEASKSIGHHAQDKQTMEMGIQDKVSYTLFYLYQRLEQVHNEALAKHVRTISSLLITILGKITIDAGIYDISLTTYPLHYLGRFTREALVKNWNEVVDTSQFTLLAVSKQLLSLDLTYLEIRDPFLSVINTLEEIAKESFKHNKSANLTLIIQPFRDLKALFDNEKMANHPDTPVIMQNIDRVIGEFEALEMVMKTMPSIPTEEINPSS